MARREDVLEREVFSVGERTFRWRDVIAAARIWSDWAEVEQRARQTIELRAGSGDQVPRHEVEEAQNRFRYDRNLLAADDLEAWLGRWGVPLEDWFDHVRGAVPGRGGPAPLAGPDAADPAELDAAAWAEAVCSGELVRLARKLAERSAVSAADPPEELTVEELSRMDETHRRFRDAAVTNEALGRRLQDERLEWTRIDARYLAHRDEDVVREAALGVREEGRDLEEMAHAAGARYEPAVRFYLSDLDPGLAARLLAASPGELCGPFPSGEEQWLLEVGARTPPSLDDAEVRARAAAELVERAVEQLVLRNVRWHERLDG